MDRKSMFALRMGRACAHKCCLDQAHGSGENEPAEDMYFIETGRVRLVRYGLTLGVLSTGGFFGTEGLLPGKNAREHTVTAMNNCELLFMAGRDVQKIALKHPELIANIREAGARRARREDARLNQLIRDSAASLGVDVGSSVMDDVLSAIDLMAHDADSQENREVPTQYVQTIRHSNQIIQVAPA
jgi:CRP-like cAMP-binding protein